MDLIYIEQRLARITLKYNSFVWRLQFLDNNEIVNIFYSLDSKYRIVK